MSSQPTVALTVAATTASGQIMNYQAGSPAGNDAGQSFYPSGIPLPTAARWMPVTQAGDSWGASSPTCPDNEDG